MGTAPSKSSRGGGTCKAEAGYDKEPDSKPKRRARRDRATRQSSMLPIIVPFRRKGLRLGHRLGTWKVVVTLAGKAQW